MKLLKIPFDACGMGHGNGAKEAPRKIIEALCDVYTSEAGVEPKFEHVDVETPNDNVAIAHVNIASAVPKESFVALGGDHSITYPLVMGFVNQHGRDTKFVVFDAHPDMVNNFHPPSQEDYLRTLIEDNILRPENVLLVGLRNCDPIELKYMKEKNISYITSKEIYEKGIKWVQEQLIAFCKGIVYCSFDIDVVDPAFAPGTGWCEPAGITSREAVTLVQTIAPLIHSADIVEVNPPMDVNDMTSALAAKILVEFFK